jgi:hypothetical protein
MTTPIPFVPSPLLKYTERYNRQQDELRIRRLEDQRAEVEREALKLEKHQEEQRLVERKKMQAEMKDLNLYNHMGQVQAYRDYKYAYWVGTLIDQYI